MSQGVVDGNYIPIFPPERQLYESLWKYVNPNLNEVLSGSEAVPFFQKSEVDIGILRQVIFFSFSLYFVLFCLLDLEFINC